MRSQFHLSETNIEAFFKNAMCFRIFWIHKVKKKFKPKYIKFHLKFQKYYRFQLLFYINFLLLLNINYALCCKSYPFIQNYTNSCYIYRSIKHIIKI